MREIKFRGKPKRPIFGNVLFYGYYIYDEFRDDHLICDAKMYPDFCIDVQVFPETVGQYTGISR